MLSVSIELLYWFIFVYIDQTGRSCNIYLKEHKRVLKSGNLENKIYQSFNR